MNAGREWRPLEVLPVTAGFGSQRVQPREMQAALYLFDEGIDLTQPITVTAESARVESWSTILRLIERERALVRSRSSRTPARP